MPVDAKGNALQVGDTVTLLAKVVKFNPGSTHGTCYIELLDTVVPSTFAPARLHVNEAHLVKVNSEDTPCAPGQTTPADPHAISSSPSHAAGSDAGQGGNCTES